MPRPAKCTRRRASAASRFGKVKFGGYSMWFIYKSRHVNYGREQVVFRCKMENIIDTYRNRINAMGYEPSRQEDIPAVMAAYCEAIANCKIEGLELVSDDHSFCLLLVETQIPVDVAIGLAQDYNRDVLSRQKLAA